MNAGSNGVDENKDKSLIWFWVAVIGVVLIWLFNAFGFQLINPNLESRAQNGDMFGPTNALFSGLAFAGLIYTIIMQRKELEMQRKELKMQREVMQGASEEQAKQAKAQEEHLKELKIQNLLTIAQGRANKFQIEIDYLKLKCDLTGPIKNKNLILQEIEDCVKQYENVLKASSDTILRAKNLPEVK